MVIQDSDLFEKIRETEFKRLDDQNHVYLDFTGGGLYPSSLIEDHHHWLLTNTLGNPHSTNPTSQAATFAVESAREKVLSFFNAQSDYMCIFTMNASGALKIIGETFPFNPNSVFVLTADNHNSVNGIREFCINQDGEMHYAPLDYHSLTIDKNNLEELLNNYQHKKHKLFAFPAQSNVTGIKHDLLWVEYAQKRGWDVLLDAAAFVPTSTLDLNSIKPNYVSISFYKMFGYPTGLGCLLLRKDSFEKLEKPWFAGGTVTLASVNSPNHFLANTHERFEDGTVSYLSIPAVETGLDFLEQLGMEKINQRIKDLISYLMQKLNSLEFSNGQKKVQLFGQTDLNHRGGTLVMSFFHEDGSKIDFEDIERLANNKKISIRSGCFCNPGIDEINNCLTTSELSNYYVTHKEGDYKDMIHALGKMRGATRVSVGIASTFNDLDRFISFADEVASKLDQKHPISLA